MTTQVQTFSVGDLTHIQQRLILLQDWTIKKGFESIRSNCVADTSLEIPTFVPGPFVIDFPRIILDSSDQSVSFKDVPPTSLMAYLRERYTSNKLATVLMLKSWRSITNKS